MKTFTSGTTGLTATTGSFERKPLTMLTLVNGAPATSTYSGAINPAATGIIVCNEGSSGGFFAIDTGHTPVRLPAASIIKLAGNDLPPGPIDFGLIKDSSNMSAVYAAVLV